MITPHDIDVKEFSNSIKGYNKEEVDYFLDEIGIDLGKLQEENEKLKAEVKKLTEALDESKRSENSVLNTLESAKHLMSDISASAEKRAEIILKNARLDAEVIQREARDSIGRLTEEADELKNKVARYRERYRQLLEDELNQLEGSSASLFADLERDFMPASMEKHKEEEKIKEETTSMSKEEVKPEKEISAIDMIMEDFKKSAQDSKSNTRVVDMKEDMSKTRIF